MEPLQPARAPHVRRGRATTAARCSGTSRPPTPTRRGDVTSCSKTAREYKDHEHSRHEPARLRSRRRRRRADARRCSRSCARAARPAGPAAHAAARRATEFFEALEAEPPSARSSSASCTSSTTAASTRRRRGQARQPPLRAGAARRRVPRVARGGDYPRAELDRLWKLLLLQQFHDILPGSSIRLVYEDAARDFAELEAGGDRRCSPRGRHAGEHDGVRAPRGRRRPDAWRRAVATAVRPRSSSRATRCRSTGSTLENAHLRVRARATDGSCSRASSTRRPAARRSPRPGNRFELYDDRPGRVRRVGHRPVPPRDAPRRAPAETWAVVTATPLRGEIAFERRSARRAAAPGRAARRRLARGSSSTRRSTGTRSHTLLKVCFPLAVRAPNATYEMPFGYAERPTHYSTQFDARSTRCPATASPISRSTASAPRCSPTRSTATAVTAASCASACCARRRAPTPRRTWARTSSRTRSMPHAGGWREAGVARARRRCFNAPLRWTAVGPADSFAIGRRPERRARHDQARRGLRRSRAAPVRAARRPRRRARAARAAVRSERGARTRSRTTARRCRSRAARSCSPYRPREVMTVKVLGDLASCASGSRRATRSIACRTSRTATGA